MTPDNNASDDEGIIEEDVFNEFIEIESNKIRVGSGDDEYYVNKMIKYLEKQKEFIKDLINFTWKKALALKEKQTAEKDVAQAVAKLQEQPSMDVTNKFGEKLDKIYIITESKLIEIFGSESGKDFGKEKK